MSVSPLGKLKGLQVLWNKEPGLEEPEDLDPNSGYFGTIFEAPQVLSGHRND